MHSQGMTVRKRAKSRKARSEILWAVVVVTAQSEWIHWRSLAHTKLMSWRIYLEEWLPPERPRIERQMKDGGVRLARVKLSLYRP